MYRYVGSDVRVYPYARIGGVLKPLTAHPGDEADWDDPPTDGHWVKIKTAAKAAPTAAKAAKEE